MFRASSEGFSSEGWSEEVGVILLSPGNVIKEGGLCRPTQLSGKGDRGNLGKKDPVK